MSVLDEAIRVGCSTASGVYLACRYPECKSCRHIPNAIEAAARVLIPHNPTPGTVEALAAGHWEHGHTIAWQELGPAIRADLMEYALAAYRAQPIWQELWGAK